MGIESRMPDSNITTGEPVESDSSPDAPQAKKAKKVKPQKLPERDIQTWFRLTSKNLYTRERFLDIKANIMLSLMQWSCRLSVQPPTRTSQTTHTRYPPWSSLR